MMHPCTSLLVLSVLVTYVCSQSVSLKRFYLNTVSPLAICNDGTPAVMYYRPGLGSGAYKWIIRLQGGGWCWDGPSCVYRAKNSPWWVTSSVCPPQILDNETISNVAHEGILSSDPLQNPYFYNYNHVYLWYCSSDSFVGNISSSSINGWPYQGKNIVRAMITLLSQSMQLADATDVLLTGDSAGGVATVNNADYLGGFVKAAAPTANYRAFVDCAWFLDIPAFGTTSFSFQMVAKLLLANWNAVYDESCTKFYGTGNEWHCFHTQYAWQHLETSAFYEEFQFDSANLGFNGAGYPWNSSTQQYALNFQADMLAAQLKVPYLFSPNCYVHEVIDSTLFTTVYIGNYSIADAVANWFLNAAPPPLLRYVDTCAGVNCNKFCPPL